MNGTRTWAFLAVAVAAALAMAADVQAQAYRARPDAARTVRPGTAGGAAGATVRIRQFTGYGPRGVARLPDMYPRGRAPARDWDEMQVAFDTDPAWIDELVFVYYALLYEKATGEFTFLKGQVTHVDVARGRNHLSSAYIRPNTLARYGEVVAVAVEVLVAGETVATQSEGKLPHSQPLPADWWKNSKLVPKDGLILSKPQTPFAYVSYDDYEAVK